jgi:hypothetical protein
MYVGDASLAPRKFSPITGLDHIYGQTRRSQKLGALAAVVPPFPADLAQGISDDFAPYRAAAALASGIPSTVQGPNPYGGGTMTIPNPAYVQAVMAALRALPSWYAGATMPMAQRAFVNVSQGANGSTGYVSYRVLNRNGVKIWEVPAAYKLNEGMQMITPSMANAAGGIARPGSRLNASFVGPAIIGDTWFFAADPRPYLPVGQIGAGYTGGPSGKSITMQAVKGIAMTVLPVVAGVVAAPLIFGAAGAAGAGAGAAAGEAIGAGVVPGVTGAGAAAGAGSAVTTAALVPTVAVAAPVAASAAAPAAGGIFGTGITASQVSSVIGAAKAAYALATGHAQNSAQAANAGNIPLANQNAQLAQQYQAQGDGLMATLNRPVVGGIPLWLVAAAAIAAKLAFF